MRLSCTGSCMDALPIHLNLGVTLEDNIYSNNVDLVTYGWAAKSI